jgi:uncharacterized protein involved in outer membrane biogenesis
MASLKRVELRISPLALLAQRVVIPRIDLTEPNAELQRLADGRANWTFKFDPKDPNAEPSAMGGGHRCDRFRQGPCHPRRSKPETQLDLLIDPLGKPIPFSDIVGDKAAKTARSRAPLPGLRVCLKVKGQYHGQKLSGQGKIGGLLALQDATRPFPLQAQAKIGDTSVELAGTLTDPMNLGALDLRLKLAGTSLGNLYPLTGVTLPDTPPYATDGHLIAKLHEPGGARCSAMKNSTARSAPAISMAT